jgi:putative ABC transport system ATP-binding protein
MVNAQEPDSGADGAAAFAPMTPPMIEVDQVRFRWHRGLPPCLDIASLRIEAGERVLLHGPSGSGKSTLLGLFGGVLRPEQGRVVALGRDLSAMPAAARDRFRVDHVGFVFQQFNLVPYLSVIDNVLLPCRFSRRRRDRAIGSNRGGAGGLHQAANQLLAALDLAPDLAHRPVTRLSVGQQQRVAVARALIGRPEIVIADEPTSALDEDRRERFLDLLLRECEVSGAGLVFVSHDRRLAPHFSRVLALAALNRAASEVEAVT